MIRTLLATAVLAGGLVGPPLWAQDDTESHDAVARDSVSWQDNLDDALALAQDEGKRIMLILGNAK